MRTILLMIAMLTVAGCSGLGDFGHNGGSAYWGGVSQVVGKQAP